ncbi:MAG TPA: hypothetical protein VHC49_04810 [Mycobacteriales bacterium]|nr:hypothetical protein [Mycobacteriales bacterium]
MSRTDKDKPRRVLRREDPARWERWEIGGFWHTDEDRKCWHRTHRHATRQRLHEGREAPDGRTRGSVRWDHY